MKKLTVFFSNAFVLEQHAKTGLIPAKIVLEHLQATYEVQVLESSFMYITVAVKNENATKEDLLACAWDCMKAKFGVTPENADDRVRCTVTDKKEEETEEKPDAEALEEENPNTETLDRIRGLVGAEDFKELAEELAAVAPLLIRHKAEDTFTNLAYLWAINDGCGLSTCHKLLTLLARDLKLMKFDTKPLVVEHVLRVPQPNQNFDPFEATLDFMKDRSGASTGCALCLDISEWMSKTREREFREFLKKANAYMGNILLVFRVPFVEKETLNDLGDCLKDVLQLKTLSFVPFSQEELLQCALQELTSRGYTADDSEVRDIMLARLCEEKSDGRFYGINTVKKIVREMIYQKHAFNAAEGFDDSEFTYDDVNGLANTGRNDSRSGLEMLDDFIGMESIKTRVMEIVAQIEMLAQNKTMDAPCLHMRFVGNPGTGKTTVARVIGKILKEKGILRNGNFFEYAGRDFCGRFVGETAPKTAGICRDAYGSVLFIDEAYSLYRGEGTSKVDYGREAIDTLIAEMENHRNELVVIMAGYPEEMKDLMKGNAGLESRMPYVIEFPNYTREQLFDIFMRMVRKNFTVDEAFEKEARQYFLALPDVVLNDKAFSNARFARNLYERTWAKATLRVQLNKADPHELIKEDFMAASAEKEFSVMMQKKPTRTLGFV